MLYNNFKLTDEGRKLLADVRDGDVGLDFRCLAIGAGEYGLEEKEPSYLRNIENLKDERQRVSFSFIDRKEDGSVGLKVSVSNEGLKDGYYMTEAGIYAGIRGSENEVLYCIALADHPDYMPDESSEKPFQVIFNITVGIGDADKVSIRYDDDTFALAEDLQAEITRAISAEIELAENQQTSAEKFDSHVNDTENPHQVTKTQVGLGNVPNVTTNDQTPTFTKASTRENIESGEKLSVILGKIKKFFTDLKSVAFSESYNDLTNRPTSLKNPNALTIQLNGESQGAYDGSAAKTINITPGEIGLGNVNNTSDMNKPVSAAQQEALDTYYQQSTGYTDQKIAGLINGAPSTLDTLGEIANAMADNADVVEALEEAVGKKASAAEFDSHAKDKTVHITAAERQNWNDPAVSFTQASSRTNIGTDEKLSVILGKIKKWFADLKSVAFSGSYNDLSNRPTSMKNPSALTIQLNGTSQGAYDGSAAKTINVTPGGIGALHVAGGTITGDLRLQGDDDETYGRKLNFGDGDYVHLYEYEDDKLEIKASTLKISSNNSILVDQPIMGNITGNAASATKWSTARTINGMSVDGTNNVVNYGVCPTISSSSVKHVICEGFVLIIGAEITAKFSYTNVMENPTLNVNFTGEKPIYYRGTAIPAKYLAAGRTYTFRYNGLQYDLVGDVEDLGTTDISTIGDGTVTGAIALYNLNFTMIGGGGRFVNYYKEIMNSEKQQVFRPPTNGKTFVALQFLMGNIVMPDDNIESLKWDTTGLVTLTRKVTGAYANWEFYIFYLLV